MALLSATLGGPSIWALRIHQTTTYFTGMLSTTINAPPSGAAASTGTSLRWLGDLIADAVACRARMHALRLATPAVSLLLAAAATMRLRIKHQGRRSRSLALRHLTPKSLLMHYRPSLSWPQARYRASPPARTMPVMLRVAALPAVVKVNGIATAPTTALDFPRHTVSLTLRLPLRLPSDDQQPPASL